jgi:hypothetical protein
MDGLGCGAEVNAWRLGSRDKVSGRQSASTYKWCRPDAARSCTRVPRQAFRNRNTLPDRTDRSGNAVCRRVTDVLLIRGALGVVQRRSTGRSTRPSWPRLTRGVLAFALRASLARHAGGSASDHPSLTVRGSGLVSLEAFSLTPSRLRSPATPVDRRRTSPRWLRAVGVAGWVG